MKNPSLFIASLLILGLSGCQAVDQDKEFLKIADASCERAMALGVVESSLGGSGFTQIMVPKDQAYKDFSAAYFAPPNTYEIIYELDAFTVCYASMTNLLAKEAGIDSQIQVKYSNGRYLTFEDLGDAGISQISYEVKDGLIASMTILSSSGDETLAVKYGQLTGKELLILKTAVDRYLDMN